MSQSWLFNLNALCGTSNSNNLNDLIERVWKESDNEKPIQEIDWDTVSRFHFSAFDLANTSVGSEDDNWSKVGLKGYLELVKSAGIEGWPKAVEKSLKMTVKELYQEMAVYMKFHYELVMANPFAHRSLPRE